MSKNKIPKIEIEIPSEEEMNKIRQERYNRAKINPNCMSNWLPLVINLGISIPKTKIIPIPLEKYEEEMFLIFDGKKQNSDLLDDLNRKLQEESSSFSFPLFIKTGTFSGKHSWKNTCFVEKKEDILKHYLSIVYEQHCVGASSSHVLVLRDFVKTKTDLFAFDEMPITKERRYFFKDGKVVFHHPYWPPNAIESYQKDPRWREKLFSINKEDEKEVEILQEKSLIVGKALSKLYPNWSIDWLQDENGKWFLIDVAVFEQSFMWKDYEYLTKYLKESDK